MDRLKKAGRAKASLLLGEQECCLTSRSSDICVAKGLASEILNKLLTQEPELSSEGPRYHVASSVDGIAVSARQ